MKYFIYCCLFVGAIYLGHSITSPMLVESKQLSSNSEKSVEVAEAKKIPDIQRASLFIMTLVHWASQPDTGANEALSLPCLEEIFGNVKGNAIRGRVYGTLFENLIAKWAANQSFGPVTDAELENCEKTCSCLTARYYEKKRTGQEPKIDQKYAATPAQREACAMSFKDQFCAPENKSLRDDLTAAFKIK